MPFTCPYRFDTVYEWVLFGGIVVCFVMALRYFHLRWHPGKMSVSKLFFWTGMLIVLATIAATGRRTILYESTDIIPAWVDNRQELMVERFCS